MDLPASARVPEPAVVLRPAEVGDAAALLDFFRSVGGESDYLSFGTEGPGLSLDEERAFIARSQALDNVFFLVAELEGAIVGCVTFEGGKRKRTRHIGEFGVSVLSACHGRGIGRALIERLIAWASEGGVVRKIDLRVSTDNAIAIALYQRLGFVSEGLVTRDLYFDCVFHDALMMGRAIDPPVASTGKP